MSGLAPIILFGYNRPEHIRQTLEHLARAEGASGSDLWIFCDGPKSSVDPSRIQLVREVANERRWTQCFASVRVEVSADNKGLAKSIIGGVSKVIERYGRAIVVEDDVLVAKDFLCFMNDCLDFYKDDSRVGSITGFSPFAERPSGYTPDVMAVPRNCSQCWATWDDRWRQIDWSASGAARLWQDSTLRRRFNAAGNDRVGRLRRQLAGEIDSWSIRFGLWQTLSKRHTIYPVHNRVCNIGYDGSGVHTRKGQNVNAMSQVAACPYQLQSVSEDLAILKRVARIYGGPWYRRILRDLRVWLSLRGRG